jgi:Raf kinase inhibitor-like YbhB/YbcL family protein
MALSLTSPHFSHNSPIPQLHTCDDADTAPTLEWSSAPSGTKSYVLIVDDPDAPDPKAPKMTYVHWVIYDIPTSTTRLEGGKTPTGARDGINDWKRPHYGGPCPPIGRHRYYFKLYALDAMLGDLGTRATKADVESAMRNHVLEKTELMGTYERSK